MEKIKEMLLGHAVQATFVLLGVVGALVGPVLAELVLPFVAASVTTLQLLKLVLSLSALLVVAVIYIIAHHLKSRNPAERLLKKYTFLEREGIYKGEDHDYCPSCLSKGVASPLKVSALGWRCLNKDCDVFISNPDYEEPKRRHIKRGIVRT